MIPTTLKIRMTDSLCVAKFSYIKPEVELVFTPQSPISGQEEHLLHEITADALEAVVETQLNRICSRATDQDFVMIKNSVEVDIRLKRAARNFLQAKKERAVMNSTQTKRLQQLVNLDYSDSSWGLS